MVRQLFLSQELARFEPLEDGGLTHPWIPHEDDFVLWKDGVQRFVQIHLWPAQE